MTNYLCKETFIKVGGVLITALLFLTVVTLRLFAGAYDYEKPPKRTALVIGNASYMNLAPLPGSTTDAERMRDRLTELGFTVDYHTDVPDVATFQNVVLPTFNQKLEPGALVIFYFSGHGFSFRRFNYLAPTALSLAVTSSDLPANALSVDAIEASIAQRGPGLVLFIIDACRSAGGFEVSGGNLDPWPSAHLGGNPEINSLVAWGTNLGWISEGSSSAGQMSVFTDVLEKKIAVRGRSFRRLFDDVIVDVQLRTLNRQKPITYPFSATDPFLSPTTLNIEQEREAWQSALQTASESNDPIPVKRFLLLYSVSNHADAARRWLQDYKEGVAGELTKISPVAVERAWTTISEETAKVRSLSLPLGFKRSINAALTETETLSDREVGVANRTHAAGREENFANSIASAKAHERAITTRSLRLCPEPAACGASAKQVPVKTEIEVIGLRRGDDGQAYLAVAEPGSSEQKYFRIPTDSASLVFDLGVPIGQAFVGPRAGGAPGLVDRVSLLQAVANLRAAGWTITHISISTGLPVGSNPQQAKQARAIAALEADNARFVLQQAGLERQKVTVVTENNEFVSPGVRIRFFGVK